jgi:hypothetical protein
MPAGRVESALDTPCPRRRRVTRATSLARAFFPLKEIGSVVLQYFPACVNSHTPQLTGPDLHRLVRPMMHPATRQHATVVLATRLPLVV